MIDFSKLEDYTPDELFGFGFKIYQDFGKFTLLLVPEKYYDDIPNGTELVDTTQTLVIFKKGITPKEARFKLLQYGVLIKLPKQ